MHKNLNVENFEQLNMDETISIDGGGLGALFLACIGLAVSPAVACLNPLAGAGLAVTSIGALENNWP